MNGADDVVKYSKYYYTVGDPETHMVAMGRPGFTETLRRGMRAAGMAEQGAANFVLGPELPDVSSTQARKASRKGDAAVLAAMLHPEVAQWMLRRDGHVAHRHGSGNSATNERLVLKARTAQKTAKS